MPTYVSQCAKCSSQHEFVARIANRDTDAPTCCDAQTTRVLVAPQISAMAFTGHKGFVMYEKGSPKYIESGADYHAYLKKNNVIPESEGKREAEIQRANRDAEVKKKRRDDAAKVVREALNR